MTPDDADRHLRSLLASYGRLEKGQARMETLIEERTTEALRVRKRVDDELEALDDQKAEAKDLAAVVTELGSIKRLLVMVLLAIVTASVGFGFAALQIASQHP